MTDHRVRATFDEFDLPGIQSRDEGVAIPTVRGTRFSRYGTHAYYFLNFRTQKGVCVTVRHRDIILPGLQRLAEAYNRQPRMFPRLRLLFQTYHYGFNFLEQIMLMTVPHTVTELGEGRHIVNLWSYFGYLTVDLRSKTVIYTMMNENDQHHVFGSTQWYEADSESILHMTYSLADSFNKVLDPYARVFSRIVRKENRTGETNVIWEGHFADYMHDLLISQNKRYLVACELGRFSDQNNNLIPSKGLILDLETKKEWIVSVVPNAAHAQFDPDDSDIIYFSNHNFQFVHTPLNELFKKGAYTLNFLGTASVHKFQLTAEGPKAIGVFNQPDLFRLTNFHVFKHRGKKMLAAMGAPNFIFLADADQMTLRKKLEVANLEKGSIIGTISPSRDGEKLYIQTTKTFQVIDVETGKSEFIRRYECNHVCSNHMITTRSTDW